MTHPQTLPQRALSPDTRCSARDHLSAPGNRRKKQRIYHPALLRGKERCSHHLLKSSPNHLRVARPRASCSWLCRPSWRGPGRAGDPAYDWLHSSAGAGAVAFSLLTGPGRERRLPAPGGVRAQLHSHGPLHRGDARVTLSRTTIKGGEGGGPTGAVSGSKRCLPRTSELFMHLREERNRGGWLRTSSCHPEKPIVQP